jgi:hypothetical protein
MGHVTATVSSHLRQRVPQLRAGAAVGRLGSGTGGCQILVEQVGDCHGLVAVGAGAAEADFAHESAALPATLDANGPGAATVIFVDGDGATWAGRREGDGT